MQTGLPVQAGAHAGATLEQVGEQAKHHLARDLDAVLEMHRAQQRLHAVGEDARLVAATGEFLTLAQQQVHAEPALAEPARHLGQRVHVHHAGAQLGQLALGLLRVLVVQALGDAQAEYRVAQEFQALVGRQAAVLVGVGPVRQREPQQIRPHLDAEGVEEARVRTGRAGDILADRHVDEAVRTVRQRR